MWDQVIRIVTILISLCYANSIPNDGRHSFSLSVFDPEGRLWQVDRAVEAAGLGTPIFVVVIVNNNNNNNNNNNTNVKEDDKVYDYENDMTNNDDHDDDDDTAILFAAPQILPSPHLMIDDGTTRFCQVTSEIVISHSGLSADGRVLVAAAQRLAVQHELTYNKNNHQHHEYNNNNNNKRGNSYMVAEISIQSFLYELSLFLQEYTMKPGTRPFGVTLLVGYLPKQRNISKQSSISQQLQRPRLFRVDPSGIVVELKSLNSSSSSSSSSSFVSIINGKQLDTPTVRQYLESITRTKVKQKTNNNDDDDNSDSNNNNHHGKPAALKTTTSRYHHEMAAAVRKALALDDKGGDEEMQNKLPTVEPNILTAVLSKRHGFSMQKHQ